jgi:hypothetical protein
LLRPGDRVTWAASDSAIARSGVIERILPAGDMADVVEDGSDRRRIWRLRLAELRTAPGARQDA